MHRDDRDISGKIRLNLVLTKIGSVLEVMIAIALILAIVAAVIPVIVNILQMYTGKADMNTFSKILSQLFTLLIGIEFLKMICRYNVDSVIEVILFTLARQMVVSHGTALGNLLTILGIGVLFVIRKYLFVKQIDDVDNHHRTIKRKEEEKGKTEETE